MDNLIINKWTFSTSHKKTVPVVSQENIYKISSHITVTAYVIFV